MNVKAFVDTNVLTRLRLRPSRHVFVALHTKFDSFVKISGTQGFLVYAHDSSAAEKYERAKSLVRQLWIEKAGVLSTQVLQEFYVTVRKKVKPLIYIPFIPTFSRDGRD
jgi:hypothetical protein